MKKLLFAAACIFTMLTAQAQIEDGDIAPDFTVTDVFGVNHTLSTYLAQGKTVVLDISATWCGPCWNLHNSGTFKGLHYSLGQGGTGEVVILFIEGDDATGVNCLFGDCPENYTQGNWVENTPYPVINNHEVADLFEDVYFPAVFMICPTGVVTELTPFDAQDLIDVVSEGCGTSQGIQKNARPKVDDFLVCDEGQAAPVVHLTNYGTETLTAATLNLLDGQTVVATKNFTGSINTFSEEEITFDPIAIATGQDYTVKVASINSSVQLNATATTSSFSLGLAPQSNNNITVLVKTDFYPGDISWAIKNSEGTVVATGGPYIVGTEDDFGYGGPDANVTKTHEIELPGATPDCYTVEMYDNWGDGWTGSNEPTGMKIVSGGEVIFDKSGRFKDELITPSAFKSTGLLNAPKQQADQFSLYPNPSKGIVSFSGVKKADIVIADISGKIVYTATGIENGTAINLSSLQKGLYIARISDGNTTKTEKIILN